LFILGSYAASCNKAHHKKLPPFDKDKILKAIKIKNTDFFRASYQAIIGKEKGPRLASLILAIGKEKVVKLLGTLR